MKRAPTDMERRVGTALRDRFSAAHNYYIPRHVAHDLAMVALQAARDAPHSILDAARGSRLASGEMAEMWNRAIDAASPPEDAT